MYTSTLEGIRSLSFSSSGWDASQRDRYAPSCWVMSKVTVVMGSPHPSSGE